MTKCNRSLKLKIKDAIIVKWIHFAYTVVRVRFKFLSGRRMVRWHKTDAPLLMRPKKIWRLIMFDHTLRRKGGAVAGAKYRR